MFIKLKQLNDRDILINASLVKRVEYFARASGASGCYLEFVDGTVQEVLDNLETIATLTEANSIEKLIEKLKLENTRRRMAESTQEAINKMLEVKIDG